MFRTRVACGRNPRTAEAPRPLRLFEQREGPRCSKYIAFCPSFQDAFPRFRERSAHIPDRASHHGAAPTKAPARLVAPPFSLRASSPAPPRQPANRSGRAFSRREASRACAPKHAQSGMIRLKHKETRPSSRPPPRSIRLLPPIARNEQVGFCRHFGRE